VTPGLVVVEEPFDEDVADALPDDVDVLAADRWRPRVVGVR